MDFREVVIYLTLGPGLIGKQIKLNWYRLWAIMNIKGQWDERVGKLGRWQIMVQ